MSLIIGWINCTTTGVHYCTWTIRSSFITIINFNKYFAAIVAASSDTYSPGCNHLLLDIGHRVE